MKRIIIDSQSNVLLRHLEREQRYDQRGGLCQVGDGHLVLTTDPVDPDFLAYWRGLGLSLPTLVAVGPYRPGKTLSELVLDCGPARRAIAALAADGPTRLEFYCIEQAERDLAEALGVPAYCGFDVSMTYAGKLAFKALCADLGLATMDWFHAPDRAAMLARGREMLAAGLRPLLKTESGMGGVSCGGMAAPRDAAELQAALDALWDVDGKLFLERRLDPLRAEFSVHWELRADGAVAEVTVFDSITKDDSYRGTAHPALAEPELAAAAEDTVRRCLAPRLAELGGLGFFCCDVLVGPDGTLYWNDFNPRKGASVYVRDMARRLGAARLGVAEPCFWHEGLRLGGAAGLTVADVLRRLDGMTEPGPGPFVVLTNPGVVPHGRVDLTGISATSREEARAAFLQARERLAPLF